MVEKHFFRFMVRFTKSPHIFYSFLQMGRFVHKQSSFGKFLIHFRLYSYLNAFNPHLDVLFCRLEQLQRNPPQPYVEEHTVSRQKVAMVETRSVDPSPYFKYLDECIEWCSKKLKQIKEADYGSDLPGVQAELNIHLREHNSIEQFHSRCEQCINAKYNLTGDELSDYTQNLNTLTSLYTDLLSTSNKRMSALETLQDFLQSVTNLLNWLKEKEEIEVTRDWSDTELNLTNVEQYYRVGLFIYGKNLLIFPEYYTL